MIVCPCVSFCVCVFVSVALYSQGGGGAWRFFFALLGVLIKIEPFDYKMSLKDFEGHCQDMMNAEKDFLKITLAMREEESAMLHGFLDQEDGKYLTFREAYDQLLEAQDDAFSTFLVFKYCAQM